MNKPLEPLWRALREYGDPRDTEAGWRQTLGPSWEASQALFKLTRDRACSWPCGVGGGGGCRRRVVEHPDGALVAVCGDRSPRCDRVAVRGAQLGLWRLDLRAVGTAIATLVGSDAITGRGRRVTVGPTALGGVSVAIVVCSASSLLELLQVADELGQVAPGSLRLLLAPLDRPPSGAEATALARSGTEVLDLASHTDIDEEGVTVDLADWALQHREDLGSMNPTALLGARYDLVLDPRRERVWLWGTEVDLRRRQRPRWLLQGLAGRPGQVVTRDELFDEVWPDKAPSDAEAWEINLRSMKAEVVRLLKPALNGRKAPIEAVQGSAVDGGYRLLLEPERVAWWSDPIV